MILRTLLTISKAYSRIYFVLMVAIPIYVVLGWLLAASSTKLSSDVLWKKVFAPSLMLLLSATLFAFWWRIFKSLSFYLESISSAGSEGRDVPTVISKLLLAAFVLELINGVLGSTVFYFESADWKSIQFPSADGAWPQQVWGWLQFSLKISATGGFFVTPRTTGLSTLFLAGICHVIGRRKHVET